MCSGSQRRKEGLSATDTARRVSEGAISRPLALPVSYSVWSLSNFTQMKMKSPALVPDSPATQASLLASRGRAHMHAGARD